MKKTEMLLPLEFDGTRLFHLVLLLLAGGDVLALGVVQRGADVGDLRG